LSRNLYKNPFITTSASFLFDGFMKTIKFSLIFMLALLTSAATLPFFALTDAVVPLGQVNRAPVISSVSPIYAKRLQTITIKGSGFSDTQPQLLDLGDGSVDTVGGGTTPAIRIYDQCGLKSWQAGVQDNPTSGADCIGIILVSWSDTEIVLGGFGTALNTDGEGQWNLLPGDQLLISVLTANGHAAYTTTVLSNSLSQNPDVGGVHPVISSVSPIVAAQLQTILIHGSGFGDVPPQLMNLSDGSVATVVGGATPVIRIYDIEGWDSWEAGCQDSQWVPKDTIGVYLTSWSDTKIVLGGFGTELTVNGSGSWNIKIGDPLIINVQTANGHAAYAAVVSNESTSNPTAPQTPVLAVSCRSSTTFSNFRVEISGSLTYNETGLQGCPILLSYSVDGGDSWSKLTSVSTDSNGEFLAVWLPAVTGNYLLKAEWAGDDDYSEASTVINFAVSPSGEENVFSVTSNSTISALAFNSTSGELDFAVSGPSGTAGYCNVYVPKALISDASSLKVLLDGNPIACDVTSAGDSWFVSFIYSHSFHKVAVKMNAVPSAMVSGSQLAQWIAYGVIIVLLVIVAVLLASRKTKKPSP
jgi:hypothetical protein